MKNKGTWIIVGIVAAFVLLTAGIFVTTNNRAISLEEQVLTADSDVQTQEKRRADMLVVRYVIIMQMFLLSRYRKG